MAQRNARNARPSRHGGFKKKKPPIRWRMLSFLAAMPIVALSAAGFGLWSYMQIEQMDGRFCYARPDQAQLAVYLDYSVNPDLTPAQRRDIRRAALQAYDALPPNGVVMIFTSARDRAGSIAAPVVALCRAPRDVSEQAAINAPDKNTQKLNKDAQDARAAFVAAVETILAETLDSEKAARESALLADLQSLSRYQLFQSRDRRLFWLSDGLENSSTARFGQVAGDMPSVWKFAQRADYDVIKPDPLTGMDVMVLLVESFALPQPGLEYVTASELHAFWPAFFELNGATRARLQRLRRVAGS